jgi:hypothetical protein
VTRNDKKHRPEPGRPAHSTAGMNEAQRCMLRIKRQEGFEVVAEEYGCVVIRNGNDWQLIRKDGKTQRAHGARR